MKPKQLLLTILLAVLSTSFLMAQQSFVRSAEIETPPADTNLGIGNVLTGLDLDNDGKQDMYFVNNMLDQDIDPYTPRIYKYEYNGSTWDSVWSAKMSNIEQNTWPTLNHADLDGDGKGELVWGIPNNLGVDANPPRFVVFETAGDGSDELGVSDGNGNYTPNTQWNLDLPDDTEMRAIVSEVTDIDEDGTQEVIFADRKGYFKFGVMSVDNVPDDGSGGETWTLEMSGRDQMLNKFVRSGAFNPSEGFNDLVPGIVGNVISGMDYDGDGLNDMYLVNDNWSDAAEQLNPKIYKFELVNGAWVQRWSDELDIPQNTWPTLNAGDWDNDGKGEIIWCPINYLGEDNVNPDRIFVYETPGDNSDVMGISDGTGGYMPNASWNFDVPDDTEMRPQHTELVDFDNDGSLELVFAERKDYYNWGVVGVDNIPDNGDGSETWTMEANGTGAGEGNSLYRDMAIINGNLYLMTGWSASPYYVTKVTHDGSSYSSSEIQTGTPWSFNSASTVDLNDDGTEEFLYSNYSGTNVYVVQEDADTLLFTQIANAASVGMARIPGGNAGDIDADGMTDYVIGDRSGDIVASVEYQGGDIADSNNYTIKKLDEGVTDGAGGNLNLVYLANIDGDDSDEIFYSGIPRYATTPLVVGHYSDTLSFTASSCWDLTIANGNIYPIDYSGNVYPVVQQEGEWVFKPRLTVTGWNSNFRSAEAADVDGNGTEEIIIGEYNDDGDIRLLTQHYGALKSDIIANIADLDAGDNRIPGGAAGDIDQDGYMDFVFGSRSSDPIGQIYRVEYLGGDLTDPMNYQASVIDKEIPGGSVQYSELEIANTDSDGDLEVVYTHGTPRGGVSPIVVLDLQKVEKTPIGEVVADEDGDYVPDNLGEKYTVQGVVTTVNFQEDNDNLNYVIQDETGGVNLFNYGDTTSFDVGELVQVTGTVGQYNGLTQLSVDTVFYVATGTVPEPKEVTVDEFLNNAEEYENELIKFNSVEKVTGDWPSAGNDANLTFWDGNREFTFRIDLNSDLDDNEEPTYPIDFVGVASQFTYSDTADDGYQIIPSFYDDITQGVAALPSPYFFFHEPADGDELVAGDSSDTFNFSWSPSVDLNGDNVIYQMVVLPEAFLSSALSDTMFTMTGEDIAGFVDKGDTLTTGVAIRSKGSEADFTHSVDTIQVTFINDIIVGVNDEVIPETYYVKQNYPNPFNPTTTIQFGLPERADVTVRIYDILGRRVATLINNKQMSAGTHNLKFNASDLASGTYIYRVKAADKVFTKKMLLLK